MRTDAGKILIVDDQKANTRLIANLLADYECETACSGQEALAKLDVFSPDLILLDVIMPEMDGYQLCEAIKANSRLKDIPIVMVTSLDDRNSKIRGLEAGANEFLTKPIDPTELRLRTANLLKVKEYADFLANHNRILQEKLAERSKALEVAYIESISRLSMAAEFKDTDTGRHIRRITEYTRILSELAGFSSTEQSLLAQASPMHDIGKIGIPDHILLKPGPLEPEEIIIMQSHTTIGGKILANATSALLQTARQIALEHHERWDGSGYPAGHAGEKIPVAARIVSLVDQYDALRSQRPYKKSFDHANTMQIITEGDGRTMPSHFDPKLLSIFKENHVIFQRIFRSLAD
jgi:putative two-component system response regulator